MNPRKLLGTAFVAVTALGMAGCGGNGSEATPNGVRPGATTAMPTSTATPAAGPTAAPTTPSTSSHNPTAYNAITDTNVYSSPAPKLGAAGTVTVDPDFGSKVLRVTQSGSCGTAAGGAFASNEGNGWARTINSNDQAVLISGPEGFFYLQPISLSSSSGMSLSGDCITVIGGAGNSLSGIPFFAATQPELVYGLDADGKHFDSFNWNTLVTTQLVDVSTIPGFTPVSLYLAYCDANDAWCATSSNTQDSGTEGAFYNLKTGQTAVVNLAAATVQLNGGAPQAMDNITAALLAGCGIHEMIQSPDGTWVDFTLDDCTSTSLPHGFDSLYWQVGTNHVTYIQDENEVGGHEAMGIGPVYVNAPGSPPGCSPYDNFWVTLWNLANPGGNPGNWVGVSDCTPVWSNYDNHFSWLNNRDDSYANSYPLLSLATNDGSLPNTGMPYEWEIDMLSMANANTTLTSAGPYGGWPAAETVWRIAHTYNDDFNDQCAAQGYQSANISMDGKYAFFTSDWLGGTGTGSCTNNRRTDVFVVQLPLN